MLPPRGSDTTREAAAVQREVLRRMPPLRRLELALEMSLLARSLHRARLRAAHPDWTEVQLTHAVLEMVPPGSVSGDPAE